MGRFTNLTSPEIRTILTPYGVKDIVSHKILSGGSANTNYLVTTNNKFFVLTICEEKSQKETTELANLLMHLGENNFPTSKLISTINQELTSVWNNKPILLKEFIKGKIVQNLSKSILIYLGKELGKLHQIKAPDYLPRKVAFGINHFDEVKTYASDSTFYKWLKHTQNYIENHITIDLPKALIHTDIFYNNIIIHEDGLRGSIMDFEEACYYYRIFDIGMMIVGTCRDKEIINLDKVASLLEGYQNEINLLPIEKKSLKAFTVYAATATAFWRHQNYNHVNITPEKKGHYKEMKRLADSIMVMPDNWLYE
ncbi:homoserine kinase [uncultured Maribacter sp.]|mgnify:CR=1 FL=1|uniref:homoserine kinase n=1 Tax=uncultured Maribacter sp. TaxID=431308 RepID=UPI0030EE5C5D|tara:strand:- start:5619 stop:6551 length:933 start_codon:yes stop_codon:yes gene_type:complete